MPDNDLGILSIWSGVLRELPWWHFYICLIPCFPVYLKINPLSLYRTKTGGFCPSSRSWRSYREKVFEEVSPPDSEGEWGLGRGMMNPSPIRYPSDIDPDEMRRFYGGMAVPAEVLEEDEADRLDREYYEKLLKTPILYKGAFTSRFSSDNPNVEEVEETVQIPKSLGDLIEEHKKSEE